jgi:hypothetical protein
MDKKVKLLGDKKTVLTYSVSKNQGLFVEKETGVFKLK